MANESEVGTSPAELIGAMAGAMGALGDTTKELSRWDRRDLEREAREKAELESIQKHRANVDAEHKRTNDLYEAQSEEIKKYHDEVRKLEANRMVLVEREVKALERIADALTKR